MQADTEWNDVLREKGIIPDDTNTITEDEIVQMVEETVDEKSKSKAIEDMTLDELDELEDEEDERALLAYRQKRIQEMTAAAKLAKYGEVREITAVDYIDEVNKAGDGVWVILHLYKQGIPLCTLINQHLSLLAKKFPATKFLKSISTTCIPNFPDKNLPTIFVYFEGNMKHQLVGPTEFRGMNLTVEELEWLLSEAGAVKTDLEKDPRPKIEDVMFSSLRSSKINNGDSDENDW